MKSALFTGITGILISQNVFAAGFWNQIECSGRKPVAHTQKVKLTKSGTTDGRFVDVKEYHDGQNDVAIIHCPAEIIQIAHKSMEVDCKATWHRWVYHGKGAVVKIKFVRNGKSIKAYSQMSPDVWSMKSESDCKIETYFSGVYDIGQYD